MRAKILTILRKADGKYVSGEYLAEKLSVSRTAIWKHICALKEEGYNIESKVRNGYRIISSPDVLTEGEISAFLTTNTFGRNIQYFKTVTSTNKEAKTLAQKDAPEGTIVVSEEQNSGKGRLSRGWFSPSQKGIWFSLILRPHFLPPDAPKCTLMAAVAICKAIHSVTGINPQIKWPNDILYNNKKFVGILTEISAEIEQINYIIIGMGIDVNISTYDMPADIRTTSTSLLQILGAKVSRVELLCSILKELELAYSIIQKEGFEPILKEWKKYTVTLGQQVKVIGINDVFLGKAVDIDDYGALLVETDGKIRRVLAGDVSIRPASKNK